MNLLLLDFFFFLLGNVVEFCKFNFGVVKEVDNNCG